MTPWHTAERLLRLITSFCCSTWSMFVMFFVQPFPMMPPPPPPMPGDNVSDENEALCSMLLSWYMSGYHTGYYQVCGHCGSPILHIIVFEVFQSKRCHSQVLYVCVDACSLKYCTVKRNGCVLEKNTIVIPVVILYSSFREQKKCEMYTAWKHSPPVSEKCQSVEINFVNYELFIVYCPWLKR